MPGCAAIPLWIKLAYTGFVVVMVPYYWRHWGPQNFLNFCDVAVLITLVGIWLENPLLISTQAIAILIPQTIWMIDFSAHLVGWKVFRMTDYMFDPANPVLLRGLSLFHGWMPILIIWLIYRLGYDRRAMLFQTAAGTVLLLICYLCFDPPGVHPQLKTRVNLNYVFGISSTQPQAFMPPWVWLSIIIAGLPVLFYWPTHLLLIYFTGHKSQEETTPLIPQ